MQAHSSHTFLTRQLLGTSVAIFGLAGLLASPPTRANGVECFSDEDAVIKCEPLTIGYADKFKQTAVCVENCAVCSQLDGSEFETN